MDIELGSRQIDTKFDWQKEQYHGNHSLFKLKRFITIQRSSTIEKKIPPSTLSLFLTKEQKRAVKIVQDFISCKRPEKVLKFLISSAAGSGKSITLTAIAAELYRNNIGYQITSYTGSSCSNVSGRTLHSLFSLKFKSSDFERLALKEVSYLERNNFRSVSFLLIEEIYTLSPAIINFISHRLQRIFHNSKDWGGISIVASGCPSQLHPVFGGSLIKNPIGLTAFQLEGIRLFKTLDTVVTLSVNIRQKSDVPFQNLLNNLKLKQVTNEDVSLLQTRLYKNISEQERLLFDKSLHIFPFNKQVRQCNYDKLLHSGIPVYKVDKIQFPKLPIAESPDLYIGKGIPICLDLNYDIKNGLNRGLRGTIESWLFDKGSVAVIFCKFPTYKGKTVEGLVPIPRSIDYVWDESKKIKIKIHYFGLKTLFSTTLHSAQGLTIDRCAVDLNSYEHFIGQSYTALSRTRSLSTICILNDTLTLDRFSNYHFMKGSTDQLNELLRLSLLEQKTILKSSRPEKRRHSTDDIYVPSCSAVSNGKTLEPALPSIEEESEPNDQ